MSLENIPERFRQRIQAAKEQQLEELDLSYDLDADEKEKLTQIPDEVFDLNHLRVLRLSGNQLTNLPDSITKLSNLIALYLSSNQLTNLPDSITKLSNLTWLNLSNNQLNNLPNSIINLSSLTWLDLSSNQLSIFPDSIGKLSSLIALDLSRNQLTNLPDSITKLSNLTWLNLSNNQLSIFPDSIGRLSYLTELYLSSNQLNELPDSLANSSNLTWLDLSRNQLATLPDFITNLSNLTTLDLSGNQLKNYLPDSITNLSNLTTLDLRDNKISALPYSFSNLSKLAKLYLTNNQLATLPDSITNLSNLTELYLQNNPLEIPPLEVATKGIEAIRAYFRQLKDEGTDYIYEAKLLIVGEAGAGKTTLAKKIENPDYQLDNNELSTEGIDITKWSFPLAREREFKVNIWDFGGQEIYHATHQFFLTKRSLYALVADTRKEDTDFYYWLNVVELLSNNSPLLIVKNEKQDRQREINERALRGQFTNLQKTLATNLKTNRGLDKILTHIQHYIQDLPIVGQALPKTWVQVRKSLEDDSRNYISLQEYLDICEANGFKKHEDKLQLSGYFHDLGVCLHFQDKEDSLLYKTVILKPEWGTYAVYKVLDNQQVINNQGHFTRNDLKNIWHENKYALMRGELLELMKKFQLCYEIPDSKDSFIAPQLLNDNQPDYNWDKSNNLILRYTYPAFMPKGIISRFIVIMHQYIHSANHNQCVWKSGAVLKQNNTLAEVIEYYGKREIIIRVLGNDKRGFMTIVANEIDKINKSYPRLNYQKLTPCNCPICKNNQNPYTYQFNELVERLANNKLTIECGKSPYHEVQVLDLIDHSIDIQKLISQAQQDNNRDANFQGDAKQLIIQLFGDFMQGNKNIKQTNLGNGDNVAGNKNIDQSRNVNISGNAQVTASGAGAFNLGDISGTVANTINQLPTSPNPNQPGIKELLIRLGEAISTSEDLDDKRKAKAFKQIEALATAAQNPNDEDMKDSAEDATTILEKIVSKLPAAAALVTICQEVLPAISHFFGL